MTTLKILTVLLAVLIGIFIGKLTTDYTDLTIHTVENSYTIKHLTVTNNNTGEITTYYNTDELKQFITDVTTIDNQEAYDCLHLKTMKSASHSDIIEALTYKKVH